MYFLQKNRGFTLVEMMVVITIIALLTGVVLTAVFNARKESRDMSRITDLQQLKLGLKLYKEAHGQYPDHPEGVPLGVGESIDTELAPFVAKVKADPSSGGVGSEYNYWYYSDFTCGSGQRVVLTAQTVENEKYANTATACGGSPEVAHAFILTVD